MIKTRQFKHASKISKTNRAIMHHAVLFLARIARLLGTNRLSDSFFADLRTVCCCTEARKLAKTNSMCRFTNTYAIFGLVCIFTLPAGIAMGQFGIDDRWELTLGGIDFGDFGGDDTGGTGDGGGGGGLNEDGLSDNTRNQGFVGATAEGIQILGFVGASSETSGPPLTDGATFGAVSTTAALRAGGGGGVGGTGGKRRWCRRRRTQRWLRRCWRSCRRWRSTWRWYRKRLSSHSIQRPRTPSATNQRANNPERSNCFSIYKSILATTGPANCRPTFFRRSIFECFCIRCERPSSRSHRFFDRCCRLTRRT